MSPLLAPEMPQRPRTEGSCHRPHEVVQASVLPHARLNLSHRGFDLSPTRDSLDLELALEAQNLSGRPDCSVDALNDHLAELGLKQGELELAMDAVWLEGILEE